MNVVRRNGKGAPDWTFYVQLLLPQFLTLLIAGIPFLMGLGSVYARLEDVSEDVREMKTDVRQFSTVVERVAHVQRHVEQLQTKQDTLLSRDEHKTLHGLSLAKPASR